MQQKSATEDAILDLKNGFDPLLSTFVASLILLLTVIAVNLIISLRSEKDDDRL